MTPQYCTFYALINVMFFFCYAALLYSRLVTLLGSCLEINSILPLQRFESKLKCGKSLEVLVKLKLLAGVQNNKFAFRSLSYTNRTC